eukprot:SAG31_NODE_6228_length_2110_cov_2.222775_2_plen_114_part_00
MNLPYVIDGDLVIARTFPRGKTVTARVFSENYLMQRRNKRLFCTLGPNSWFVRLHVCRNYNVRAMPVPSEFIAEKESSPRSLANRLTHRKRGRSWICAMRLLENSVRDFSAAD